MFIHHNHSLFSRRYILASALLMGIATAGHADVTYTAAEGYKNQGGWSVQFLDTLGNPTAVSDFAASAPTVTVYVNSATGNIRLVGSPGAILNQYQITSASGALIKTDDKGQSVWNSMSINAANHLAGIENYVSWMTMFEQLAPGSTDHYDSLGDKTCPASDPQMQGVLYFDKLAGNTLDLGNIWDTSITTDISDLTFTFSYGYVKTSGVWSFGGTNQYMPGGDGQIIGPATFPKPEDMTVSPSNLADLFPGGDGVSAYGIIVMVPEPATITLIGAAGAIALLRRKRKHN